MYSWRVAARGTWARHHDPASLRLLALILGFLTAAAVRASADASCVNDMRVCTLHSAGVLAAWLGSAAIEDGSVCKHRDLFNGRKLWKVSLTKGAFACDPGAPTAGSNCRPQPPPPAPAPVSCAVLIIYWPQISIKGVVVACRTKLPKTFLAALTWRLGSELIMSSESLLSHTISNVVKDRARIQCLVHVLQIFFRRSLHSLDSRGHPVTCGCHLCCFAAPCWSSIDCNFAKTPTMPQPGHQSVGHLFRVPRHT